LKSFLNFAGMNLLPLIINLYLRTIRFNVHKDPGINKNAVFIFWHSKMLAGWWLFRNNNSSALVSQSKDGEVLSNILIKWGYEVIRGSSSKGSKDALNKIILSAKNNKSVVITPDGPRGPVYAIKNGALIVSKECSIPVIPVRINYANKIVLSKSWDKFEIPYPFTKCDVYFGNEYFYNEFLEEKELADFKNTLSEEMS